MIFRMVPSFRILGDGPDPASGDARGEELLGGRLIGDELEGGRGTTPCGSRPRPSGPGVPAGARGPGRPRRGRAGEPPGWPPPGAGRMWRRGNWGAPPFTYGRFDPLRGRDLNSPRGWSSPARRLVVVTHSQPGRPASAARRTSGASSTGSAVWVARIARSASTRGRSDCRPGQRSGAPPSSQAATSVSMSASSRASSRSSGRRRAPFQARRQSRPHPLPLPHRLIQEAVPTTWSGLRTTPSRLWVRALSPRAVTSPPGGDSGP